ncbi:MAG: orotate phosphoribosyltransferase [Pseudomonadota bacterium]|nr:orotate phosphoribosyltransferase [Pseudomonadota bacterium]
MNETKREFLQLAIRHRILRFGEFTLKSGRRSPYFFNAGLFNSGAVVARLGAFYARLLHEKMSTAYMLYGPAYKGIPLVTTTAVNLALNHGLDIPFAFNRKEAKDHGEGGIIVGAELEGRVVIVDDVITAGTSIGESVEIIRRAGAEPAAVVIALDRQEIAGEGGLSAVQTVERDFGLPVHSLTTLDDLIGYLEDTSAEKVDLAAMHAYRERYGSA